MSETEAEHENVSLFDLAWTFNHIALASFGGGLSAWSREVLVVEKEWMGEEEFLSAMTMCRILPGANQVNMAVFVGTKMKGVAGAPRGTARPDADAAGVRSRHGVHLLPLQGGARGQERAARRIGGGCRDDDRDGHPDRSQVSDVGGARVVGARLLPAEWRSALASSGDPVDRRAARLDLGVAEEKQRHEHVPTTGRAVRVAVAVVHRRRKRRAARNAHAGGARSSLADRLTVRRCLLDLPSRSWAKHSDRRARRLRGWAGSRRHSRRDSRGSDLHHCDGHACGIAGVRPHAVLAEGAEVTADAPRSRRASHR